MSNKRLQKELQKVSETYDTELLDDDILKWQIAIEGPSETPYFGGTFIVNFVFPDDYPFSPPKVTFSTIIYHPNIDRNGNTCLASLKDKWTPALDVLKILDQLNELMKSPNPNDPLEAEIATLYVSNLKKYMEKAEKCTQKHAI